MISENIDQAWEFFFGIPSVIPGSSEPGRKLNLPHDFMIETDTNPKAPAGFLSGYYDGGTGTYTKILNIPQDYADKKVLLEFDGAYMNTTVKLNGHIVKKHHYGYSPFHVDLSPYIKPGKVNNLMVIVNNGAQPNARWYSGSGIYRHVDLLVAPKVHIAPWGIFARTSHIVNGTAFVIMESTVVNDTDSAANVWVNVKVVGESSKIKAGLGRVSVHVPAREKAIGRVMVTIENAELWDINSPNLYQIHAELMDKDSVLDSDHTQFGIRTISVDPHNGFMLNGRSLKLKGGCIHHDNGILGAASFKDSEYRKMKLHKDNGYNAIRFAHNPMSRDLLDACDRLGLLVINEVFDVWTMEKNIHDYNQFFNENWEIDLEDTMLRDRNHPSVIMWSTGNEVPERGGMSDGYRLANQIAARVRELDPTRLVTNSLCSLFNGLDDEDTVTFYNEMSLMLEVGGGITANYDTDFGMRIWADYTEPFAATLDVVGYNYLNYHYETATEKYPNRVICGTESMPLQSDKYWNDVERFPHVIGDFVWTSQDYIGEAGLGKAKYVNPEETVNTYGTIGSSPYPWRLANCSDFDLCGVARPQLFYRRIIWGSDETYIAVKNPDNYGKTEVISRWGWPECEHHWTWTGSECKPIQVDIYSAAEEVELILNGKSLGRKLAGKSNRYTASFHLVFEPGTLEAVSFIEGKRISSDKLITAGEPTGIRITPDKKELAADGQSLIHAVIEIVDSEGRLVPTIELSATAKIDGAATLAAFGTGRPLTTENYTKGYFTSYKGRLLAIVRASYESGLSTLKIEIEGLIASSIEIPVR